MTEERQPNTELRELTNEMLLTNFRWACKNWLKDEQYEPLRAEILRRMEAEKQLAEARAQLAEIHNRFCGENGEPCQVCRLKAEREEKK